MKPGGGGLRKPRPGRRARPGLEVVPVRTRAGLREFVALPWRIYANDPNWIPPLIGAQKKLLTPGRHPFWESAQRELFLARREGRTVGRIAALMDGNYNRFHGQNMGAWGFFEAENDPEAAGELFLAAEEWCRGQGAEAIRGPLNPSTNYEIGLLVDGFEPPPVLMMTHNPPYYLDLIAGCGYAKEKDLLSFRITKGYRMPEWVLDLAQRVIQKGEVTVRSMDVRIFEQEVALTHRLYNECWADNWGFVPLSPAETRLTVKEMSRIFDPVLSFFLYHGQEPIGVCTCLPDVNPFLKRLNGKAGPTALIKKKLYWSEIRGLRGFVFGIKKEYRQMGAPLVAIHHLMTTFAQSPRYDYLEMGWNLEDNQAMNRIMVEGEIEPARRFRIFYKDL